jgi:chemotaxis protein histidine kinase CheA
MNIDKSKFMATFIAEAEEHLTKLNNDLVKLEKDPENSELINELNRESHTLKGAARMMGFSDMQDVAHSIEDIFAAIANGKYLFNSEIVDKVFKYLDIIKEMLAKISGKKTSEPEIPKKETPVISEPAQPKVPQLLADEYIKIPMSRINKLMNLVGEMVIGRTKVAYKVSCAKKLNRMIKQHRKSISSIVEQSSAPMLHQLGLEAEKIKDELEALGENMSSEATQIDPIINDLQDLVRQMRMLPVLTIFDTYPRLVRDIAEMQKKNIDFEVFGESTEIDKKVLEEINPALIHILRNCVDHGISEKGKIKISAYHEGGHVVIEVSDDGRGIDIEKVKETALKKNIITKEDLEKMQETDILNMIFLPGFSTSPIITDISGRGVGLDVVKVQVQKLRGQIGINSVKNKGTKVSIKLPLTIAIIPALIIKSEGEVFAMPMLSVEESIKVKPQDVNTIEGKPAIDLRGHVVPMVKLSDILGIPLANVKENVEKKISEFHVIIASSLNKKIGFIVEDILGQDEIYVKPIGEYMGKIKNIEGATISGTGEVIIVLDVPDLIENSKAVKVETSGLHPEIKKVIKKKILVVEDSLTTRELERGILSAQGYDVDTAVDGLDGINKLSQNIPDLVVTDVQMPRMDGFELCRTLKNNNEYKHIPVVIITALEKEEDKRKGIEVGADAYITKSTFDQRNLLGTIERLIG